MGRLKAGNDRGIALLIVLLITALLIALIFEFAYATRVSLNGAVNFRDSQRAYFLARSGVNFVGMLLAKSLKDGKLQDNLEQKDWQIVPIVSSGDVVLQVRWEDESGKIPITMVFKDSPAYKQLAQLFDIEEIDQDVLDQKIVNKKYFKLLTELHQVMSDEEYGKVKGFLTTAPVQKIDVNTASLEVLRSLTKSLPGIDDSIASSIIDSRKDKLFSSPSDFVQRFPHQDLLAGNLDWTSNVFKVYSYATVGGYTKQVEAIITRSTTGFTISYWRAL